MEGADTSSYSSIVQLLYGCKLLEMTSKLSENDIEHNFTVRYSIKNLSPDLRQFERYLLFLSIDIKYQQLKKNTKLTAHHIAHHLPVSILNHDSAHIIF